MLFFRVLGSRLDLLIKNRKIIDQRTENREPRTIINFAGHLYCRMDSSVKYEAVIGLEVHIQLNTHTKLFSPDPVLFGLEANTSIHPVSLGLPGTLPVLNERAVEYAIKLGLALNCKINRKTAFARKNYFYTDLPKGYQISQHDHPICLEGRVPVWIDDRWKYFNLTRIHIEEDAGKSIHDQAPGHSLIDLNRTGVPLLELVTEPVLHSPDDAYFFLREIRKLVRYLDISDGNMEEGSLRCDANVSIRRTGEKTLGTRGEIKNLNSFSFVRKALENEILRHIRLAERGKSILQETRLYDSVRHKTYSMRGKEEAFDYRYFPEPDLPPVLLDDAYLVKIEKETGMLPAEAMTKLMEEYKLDPRDAQWISEERARLEFFMNMTKVCMPNTALKWVKGPVTEWLNNQKCLIAEFPFSAENLARLATTVEHNELSYHQAAKVLLPLWLDNPDLPFEDLLHQEKISTGNNEKELLSLIEDTIANNPDKWRALNSGKKGLIGFFMGELMKSVPRGTDPAKLSQLLMKKMNSK